MSITREQIMNKIAMDAFNNELAKVAGDGFFKQYWNDLTGKNIANLQHGRSLSATKHDRYIDELTPRVHELSPIANKFDRSVQEFQNLSFVKKMTDDISSGKFSMNDLARWGKEGLAYLPQLMKIPDMLKTMGETMRGKEEYGKASRLLDDAYMQKDLDLSSLDNKILKARMSALKARVGTGAVATAGTIGTMILVKKMKERKDKKDKGVKDV